jgi:tetratricopeptide (TPR) repeat protein
MTAAAIGVRPSNRWLYAAIALLLAVTVALQVVRDRGWAPYVPPNPTLWLQSGPVANRLALGFRNLAADIYWMRAVVYYGGKRRASAEVPAVQANFSQLYPLLDLVTSLDPNFRVAYRFGAIFLTEAYPSGPGRPDLAIALLQRGVDHDPGRWEYMEDIGFVHYWWLKDYQQAAAWFTRAGEQPGAPAWLAPLAATTLAQGGDRQSSRFLWTQLLQSTDLDWVRRNARIRLQQLDAMDTIEELNHRAKRFIARERRPPHDWREFGMAEGLRGIPLDPAGTPYQLDSTSGRVDLARESTLWPLPTEDAIAVPKS